MVEIEVVSPLHWHCGGYEAPLLLSLPRLPPSLSDWLNNDKRNDGEWWEWQQQGGPSVKISAFKFFWRTQVSSLFFKSGFFGLFDLLISISLHYLNLTIISIINLELVRYVLSFKQNFLFLNINLFETFIF